MSPRPRHLALLAAALLPVAPVLAQPVPATDERGRPIHFDAPTAADVTPLVATIRRLAHGDEVSRVLIRVLPETEVGAVCGDQASGCYKASSNGASTIVVPTGSGGGEVLAHEYGHHVERSRRTRFSDEGSGVRAWWAARSIDALLATGRLSRDYSLGWDRSLGELFAEDYVQLNAAGPWRIRWLSPPPDAVLAAMRRDLGTSQVVVPTGSAVAPAAGAAAGSIEVRRRGVLRPGRRATYPFRLVRPGRRVTVGIRLAAAHGQARIGARADVRCGGRVVAGATGLTKRPISFRVEDQGPAECALVIGRASKPLRYALTMRVAESDG